MDADRAPSPTRAEVFPLPLRHASVRTPIGKKNNELGQLWEQTSSCRM
jgi:hypothetical protein